MKEKPVHETLPELSPELVPLPSRARAVLRCRDNPNEDEDRRVMVLAGGTLRDAQLDLALWGPSVPAEERALCWIMLREREQAEKLGQGRT
jgi:hypothetical protein